MNIGIPDWYSLTKSQREELVEHLVANVLKARDLEDLENNELFKQHYRALARDFLAMYYAMWNWRPKHESAGGAGTADNVRKGTAAD